MLFRIPKYRLLMDRPKAISPIDAFSGPPSTHLSEYSNPMLACQMRSLVVAAYILRFEVGLDSGLEGLGIGANNLCNFVAALEKQEGGHGADA